METRRQAAKRGNEQSSNDATATDETQRTNNKRARTSQLPSTQRQSTSSSGGGGSRRGGRNRHSQENNDHPGVIQSVYDRIARRRGNNNNNNMNQRENTEQEGTGEERMQRVNPPPASSIQSLLTRFGANIEDIIPRMGHHHHQQHGIASGSRMKEIISGLKSEDDGVQLASLTQLVEMLSMASEDMVAGFPSDQVVPILLQFGDAEANDALVEHSLRAFAYMCEMVPSACTQVIRENGTSIIVARALDAMNGYIDTAELALQVILHLSKEHPQQCLQNGGVNAALAYIDFFPIGIQRKSMMSVANMCRGMDEQGTALVMEQLDKMIMLLDSPDAQMLEYISQALLRIIESCRDKVPLLEQIASEAFISSILAVISKRDSGNTSSTVLVNIFRMLGHIAAGAVTITHRLLQADVVPILTNAFLASPMLSASGSASGLIRSAENLYEGLSLANVLLPPLPVSAQLVGPDQQAVMMMLGETSLVSKAADTSDRVAQHRALLESQPEYLTQFVNEMLPVLINICGTGAVHKVSWRCLDIVSKVVYYSSSEVLEAGGLSEKDTSAFVASLLGSQDVRTQASGLITAEILLEKMSQVFKPAFQRQGVLYSIRQLAAASDDHHVNVKTRSKAKQEEKQRQRLKELSQLKSGPPPELLKPLLAQRAKDLLSAHFPAKDLSQFDTFTSDLMRQIKEIADVFSTAPSDTCKDEEFIKLLQLLSEEDVSTFELMSSGVVSSLVKYFQENCEEQMVVRRLEVLTRSENEQVLEKFVSRLVSAVSSLDRFPVVSDSRLYSNSESLVRFANRLSRSVELLHSQIAKIKFVKDANESTLKDFSERVTSWQMSASLSQLERFVYPRVQPEEGSPMEKQHQQQQQQHQQQHQKSKSGTLPQRTIIMTRSKSKKDGDDEPPATTQKETTSSPLPIPVQQQATAGSKQPVQQSKAGPSSSTPQTVEVEDREGGSGRLLETLDSLAAVGDFVEEFLQQSLQSEGGTSYGAGQVAAMMHRRLRQRLGEDEDDGEDDLEHEEDVDEDMEEHDEDDGLSYDEMEESYEDDEMDVDHAHVRMAEEVGLPHPFASRSNPFSLPPGSSSTSTQQPPLNQLVFMLDGKVLPSDATLQRVLRDMDEQGGSSSSSQIGGQMAHLRKLMDKVYTFTYRCRRPEDDLSIETEEKLQEQLGEMCKLTSSCGAERSRASEVLSLKVSAELEQYTDIKPLLTLLMILEWLNRESVTLNSVLHNQSRPRLQRIMPKQTFISHSLCSKVQQQLKDLLSVSYIQEWCGGLMSCCKFLFTFELRQKYFNCTAFSRLHMHDFLHTLNLQSQANTSSRAHNEVPERGLRVKKARLRISRDKILNSAYKIFEEHAGGNRTIEIEYFGEQGIGLGPTQEFYTLLSKELHRKDLGLWREEYRSYSDDKEGAILDVNVTDTSQESKQDVDYRHVYAPYGLFPRAIPPTKQAEEKTVVGGFRLVGQLVAKSLMDRRLLDLPLNRVFWKIVLGRTVDIHDVQEVDPNLGKSLLKMWEAAKRGGTTIMVDGVEVEDLCCTWVLPGKDEYELCEGGSSRMVDSGNLLEYIESIVSAVLIDGVKSQFQAFRKGFDQVFSLSSLNLFHEDEIDILLCGCGERWTVESLQSSVKFDHGYTASSKYIQWLLEVMEGFNMAQQRLFLKFITGCPRLPPGGLSKLYPRLTVVRKQSVFSDVGSSPLSTPASEENKFGMSGLYDHDLPSVMTCAHYLKLPPYSSKELMRKRLLFAITEGQGSFDLS